MRVSGPKLHVSTARLRWPKYKPIFSFSDNFSMFFFRLNIFSLGEKILCCKSLSLRQCLIYFFNDQTILRNRMYIGSERNLYEWIRPWLCGFTSGVMDISVTFPINKVNCLVFVQIKISKSLTIKMVFWLKRSSTVREFTTNVLP